jgi:hypothetical protein
MALFTNHLRAESALIQSGLELLNAYYFDLEMGRGISTADLRMAIFAMQKIFELSHLQKEEAILYPALVRSTEWQHTSEPKKLAVKSVLSSNIFVHKSLLALRLAIDELEYNPTQGDNIRWMLADFLHQSRVFLKNEVLNLFVISEQILTIEEQKSLYLLSQDFEATRGAGSPHQVRLIFNQLREAMGLEAA